MDAFRAIKEAVSARDAAARYGFEPDRAGRIRCPFHDDQNPSLRLYDGSGGWWCFVCNEGGSVIDFTARLFGLSPFQAAKKLDREFGLGLMDGPEDPNDAVRRDKVWRQKEAARRRYRSEYEARCREAERIRSMPLPPPGSPLWGQYAALLGRLDYLENYWFEENRWR